MAHPVLSYGHGQPTQTNEKPRCASQRSYNITAEEYDALRRARAIDARSADCTKTTLPSAGADGLLSVGIGYMSTTIMTVETFAVCAAFDAT